MTSKRLASISSHLHGWWIVCARFLIGVGILVVAFGQLLCYALIAVTSLSILTIVHFQAWLCKLQIRASSVFYRM